MRTYKSWVAIAAGVVLALFCVQLIVRAGDLNPPSGLVQPTGVSLTDVANGIASLGGRIPPAGGYRAKAFNAMPAGSLAVATGPGVIGRARVANGNALLTDSATGLIIVLTPSTDFVDFHVRFAGALSIQRVGSIQVDATVLYTLSGDE
ncbi:MAG: hypothetical protein ACKVZJ_01720 [Phycisphaerales bacterium]